MNFFPFLVQDNLCWNHHDSKVFSILKSPWFCHIKKNNINHFVVCLSDLIKYFFHFQATNTTLSAKFQQGVFVLFSIIVVVVKLIDRIGKNRLAYWRNLILNTF